MTELRATYRVQLRPGFGFDEVAAIADYMGDIRSRVPVALLTRENA